MRKDEDVQTVAKRNKEVLRLHRRGVSAMQIGARVGLTRQRVWQIIQAAKVGTVEVGGSEKSWT
jgi:DNA-binding CsgD family transcriptional regulator